MKSSLFVRYITVGILFTSVSMSGCAYHEYMRQEKIRESDLTNQLGRERTRSIQLASARHSLEEEIGRLNEQIKELNDEIAKHNEEIIDMKRKTNKVSSDIAQIRKRESQVKRLELEVKEKEKIVASKRREVEKLYQEEMF